MCKVRAVSRRQLVASIVTARLQRGQIALEGDPSNHSHLLITDSKGRTTGYVNGRLVTGIPGSKAIVPYADQVWKVRPEPIYRIPAGVRVSVKVEGAPLARPVVENVSLVSQNAAAVVKGLRAGPGRNARIDFGAGAASVRYHAGNLSGAAPIVRHYLSSDRGRPL